MTFGPWAGMAFTAQVASGFRDPTVSDRYYRGPTGRGFITGNPDLDPERSAQVDVGMRYTSGRLRAGLFAYQYVIDDLIERYQAAPDFFYFRNRGRARIRGVEAEAQARLGTATLDVAAAIARGVATDDDAPLDDIAPPTLVVGLRHPVGSRAFVSLRGAFYSEDDRPGPTEDPHAGLHASSTRWRHPGSRLAEPQPRRPQPPRSHVSGEHRPQGGPGARHQRRADGDGAVLRRRGLCT